MSATSSPYLRSAEFSSYPRQPEGRQPEPLRQHEGRPSPLPKMTAPGPSMDADSLIQGYAHILELKQRRKADEQRVRLRLDTKKMELDARYRNDREKFLALEGHPELLTVVEKLLKQVTEHQSKDLDREYDEEIAALRKQYEDLEASKWQSTLNIDVPAPSTKTAPSRPTPERPQPAVLPSSAAPPNNGQGPLMAPSVSGYSRGFGGPSEPIRHGPLTVGHHYPPPMRSSLEPPHQANGSRETSVPSMHAHPAPIPSPMRANVYHHPMPQMPPPQPQLTSNGRRILPGAPTTSSWPRNTAYPPGAYSTPPGRIPPLHSSYSKVETSINPSAHERQLLPPILPPQQHRPSQAEEVQPKRKATLTDSAPSDVKRAKQDHHTNGADVERLTPASNDDVRPQRTVPFSEVWGHGNPEYKHIIIQFPDGGEFYILRCEEHGVNFGEHPLRGAAKHLASAQHGRMSKEHTQAIRTLGWVVEGCDQKLMDMNNKMVLEAMKNGYKPFNANQLNKTERAKKGFPQLDKNGVPITSPLSTPVSRQRKQNTGIPNPTPAGLYTGHCVADQKQHPFIILPWTEEKLTSAGLLDSSLEDVGLFVDVVPKCYEYERDERNQVKRIKGWAEGYEDGGPLVKKREFPVLHIDSDDRSDWRCGWIEAKHLVPFDFNESSEIPYSSTAREYYARVIRRYPSYEDLRRDMAIRGQPIGPQQTPLPKKTADVSFQSASASFRSSTSALPTAQPLPVQPSKQDDVEMADVGADNNNDSDSDQESIAKSMSNSTNDVDMAAADSRRTSFSSPDDVAETEKQPLHPSAQAIAAQALSNLQTPTRSTGFTAINSRSAASSVEPPSRQGSVPRNERRRVEKIHARSKNLLSTPRSAASEQSPATAVRKPSPARLSHILGPDNSSDHLEAPTQPDNAHATPMVSPQPLSSIVVNTGLPNGQKLDRAESAPVQQTEPTTEPSQERAQSESLTPASLTTPATPAFVHQLPTVEPVPSQPQEYPTPLPSATDSVTAPTVVIPTGTEPSPSVGPLVTPSASDANSESPVKMSFIKTEAGEEPETFTVARIHVDGEEKFDSNKVLDELLVIEDDHVSGVLRAVGGSPDDVASFQLDPKEIKTATRFMRGEGGSCEVKIEFIAGKTMTVVFESGRVNVDQHLESGKIQARRFCRRLLAWNKAVDCPTVTSSAP
ncbi:hypothetical protein QBC40DRAFT_307633 [Triangularia verruculosa]|uniref:Uncharacterized protein n=1 Tax=Triangularia verruculosa TaxID=2587418 RepID=A0AAN6XEV1_9PEZI|nr:hypothetical protein QBC40DRAFT_307633 [Triangularia verruculosa]